MSSQPINTRPVITLARENGQWVARTTTQGRIVVGKGRSEDHAITDLLSEPPIPNDKRLPKCYTIQKEGVK